MTTPALGRLVSVPLREVWPREDSDFTPWLADPENLSLLADTLNLPTLEVEGTEVPVVNFRIDILARDDNGRMVVIENQFGLTDHPHLGQIMTYLSGQEGPIMVIWIAEKVREEHRSTMDWLNVNTSSDFNFFAVEVEALKIGESLPAPWFNVISKPNDWSRDVARRTRGVEEGHLDESAKAYLSYWSAFSAFLRDKQSPLKLLSNPRYGSYQRFGNIGRSGFVLNANASFRDHRLIVGMYIDHRAHKRAFDLLEDQKETIDAEFGAPLEWDRMDDKKFSSIAVRQNDMDPNVEADRPRQFDWLLDQMERFTRVFRHRVNALSLDGSIDSAPLPASIEAVADG
jgi:hypothetical protein